MGVFHTTSKAIKPSVNLNVSHGDTARLIHPSIGEPIFRRATICRSPTFYFPTVETVDTNTRGVFCKIELLFKNDVETRSKAFTVR